MKLAAQGTETARHVAALTSLACGSTVMISIKANPVFRQYRRWRIQTLAGTRKGYTAAEMSQALETNIHMIQIAEMGGGRRYKLHCMNVKTPNTERHGPEALF